MGISCNHFGNIEALLNKFDPSQLTPNSNIRFLFTQYPAFELLTLLLAPHSNLLEVILDIYQKVTRLYILSHILCLPKSK